ncbi:hypothetical protein [Microseira sp. BLCC-F43]|jgi:hypothetical protein|uniref:hypothetical protein n=1 Tax=Microseira sp. BLCC-F43 TaxID=3153602 RepID=UPI0035BB0022
MNSANDPLSPEKLQLFIAGLSGLSKEEIRKAKSLYIRNAISEYHALVETHKAFEQAAALHNLIPIFWPMLSGARRMQEVDERLARQRILDAIEVWQEDLAGEVFAIDPEETQLSNPGYSGAEKPAQNSPNKTIRVVVAFGLAALGVVFLLAGDWFSSLIYFGIAYFLFKWTDGQSR